MRALMARDERGASSLVQTVLVAPALLFALMLIVHFGLLFHAKNVAENAAQQGAAEARRFGGTDAQAQQTTLEYLEALGPKMFTGRTVQVDRTAETATVTVTGTVVSVMPGLNLQVSETASGPVERYVPTSGEFTNSEGSGDGN